MPVQKFKFQKKGESVNKENEVTEAVAPESVESSVKTLVEKLEQPKTKMPFNFKFVLRNKIELNKDNNYEQSEIEKLAKSILEYGLMHNLEGLYIEDTDTYILESGERRTRAIDYLLNKFKDIEESDPEFELYMENVKGYENGYPMNVKRMKEELPPDSKEAKIQSLNSRIRLHAANQEIRSEEPGEKLRNITEYKQLLEEKNKLLPRSQRVNVNKTIAEHEKITDRQVQKYNNVAKLIPELQEEFANNNITLNEGDSYSQLSEAEQKVLADLIQQGKKVSADELKKLRASVEEKQEAIQAKEKQIEQLQAEKEDIIQNQEIELQKLKDSTQAQEQEIRNQIQAELEANNPDKVRVEELTKELRKAEQDGKRKIDAAVKAADQKDQEIVRLQEELKKTKQEVKSQKLLDETELENVRMQAKVSLQLDQIKKSCDSYMELFQNDPKSPYKKELVKMLKQYM